MAQNWDELMGSMTTNFFKRTWSNMQRLGQVHEPTTLIIGPCETVNGRGGDMKEQPDGPANGSQPVEGVSARLHADKARWASNEIATFRVDVRNQGQREFYTFQSQEAGFLQVDGVWYHWTGAFDLKGSALPPKREYRDIPVSLGANWTATQEWRDKTKAPPPQIPLQVPPGKHTIRFAPEIRDITMKPKPQNNYLPSNPVEIEIEGNLKKPAEPDGPANGSQPVSSDPNRTPAAAGSGR